MEPARGARSKRPPFEFVLQALAELEPRTRLMFGCQAVYVGARIVLILRDRADRPEDNGVWVATTEDHHASLRRELPGLRSIRIFGSGATGWQVIPKDSEDFEAAATRVCELILAGDGRVGKVPQPRRRAGTFSGRRGM